MLILSRENVMSKDNSDFDRDDALDYVIMEDIENEARGKSGKSGCLGIIAILILPLILMKYFF